jgi:hypothetical protein
LASSLGRKRKGRRWGAAESARLRRRAGEAGEEEKEGGKERLTSGAQASASAKEKKKREGEAGRREMASWASRPGWAEGSRQGFSFFSFLFFKLLLKPLFLLKFKSKLFQTFSQKFINFLETTQATKNHAIQLMMHNHLLCLSLLNYV